MQQVTRPRLSRPPIDESQNSTNHSTELKSQNKQLFDSVNNNDSFIEESSEEEGSIVEEGMVESLFPNHLQGNFLSSSLVISEAPSIYASANQFESNNVSINSEDDFSNNSYSDQSKGLEIRSLNSNEFSSNKTEGEFERLDSLSESSKISLDSLEIGSSWALTEAALSSLPDGTIPIQRKPSSAGFTEDSSEDESIGLDRANTPNYRTARKSTRGRKYGVDEGNVNSRAQDLNYRNRKSISSSSSYPTPPPEDYLFTPSKSKRRHRTSGQGSSQKKSSSVKSTSIIHPSSSTTSNLPLGEHYKLGDAVMKARRELEKKKLAQNSIFLGGWLGKMGGIDDETLELIAENPTSMNTVVGGTNRKLKSTKSKRKFNERLHGFELLSAISQEGLEPTFISPWSNNQEVLEENELESGEETEMEMILTRQNGDWYTSQQQQLTRRISIPARRQSFSFSELPFFYLLNPFLNSSTPTLDLEHSPTNSISTRSRRANSFSSASKFHDSRITERNQRDREKDSQRQRELDGTLGETISYWRRILRGIRGY